MKMRRRMAVQNLPERARRFHAARAGIVSAPHTLDSLPDIPDAPPPLPGALAPASGPVAQPSSIADGARHALDPAYVPYERLGGWIGAAVIFVLGPLGIGGYALWSEPRASRLVVLGAIWLAILALTIASTLYFPARKFRYAAWSLSAQGLRIHSGVWVRVVTHVPRARVQHLDVRQGPIERRFGLATLVVHTAGNTHSEIELEGLRHETAHAIKDDLMALSRAGGATPAFGGAPRAEPASSTARASTFGADDGA